MLLNIPARSPVFSHLTATISGLSTIRARDIQQELADEFDNLQDVHSGIWQLTMSASAALGLWLDVISTGFIACLTFSFIIFYGGKFCEIEKCLQRKINDFNKLKIIKLQIHLAVMLVWPYLKR